MADDDQSQEKNQDPTQKRFDKAKEDGDIRRVTLLIFIPSVSKLESVGKSA